MKKFLVVGNPIEHSLSPRLHNFWIKDNSIDAIYEKKLTTYNELSGLILELKKKIFMELMLRFLLKKL